MNQLTIQINQGIRGPFKPNKLDRNDPVERVLYDNRRLEQIRFHAKPVKVRRKGNA